MTRRAIEIGNASNCCRSEISDGGGVMNPAGYALCTFGMSSGGGCTVSAVYGM